MKKFMNNYGEFIWGILAACVCIIIAVFVGGIQYAIGTELGNPLTDSTALMAGLLVLLPACYPLAAGSADALGSCFIASMVSPVVTIFCGAMQMFL